MQHFANFGIEQVAKQGMGYLQNNPIKGLAAGGAIGGAIHGTGILETEEEKAKTTGLERLGKIVGNSALGASTGAASGYAMQKGGQLGAKYARQKKADADALNKAFPFELDLPDDWAK
jgi:hypothetical protein